MLWFAPACDVLPKERKLLVRCDEVLLGRDRNSSLASPNPEKLLRVIACDTDGDRNVSPDSLMLCPLCSPCVKGVEGLDNGAEGVRGRGFEGARNPSYSKKSSWAPAVGLSFAFLSKDIALFPLENIFLTRRRSVLLQLNPLFTPAQSCFNNCAHGQPIFSTTLSALIAYGCA